MATDDSADDGAFDSGSSWSGVVNARPNLSFPADLYLEGSDQHRGWFQSSLLTAVASEGVAPYKNVLTHRFVLDEKGIKMSKSIGNVVDPIQVIEGGNNKKKNPAYGADVLRLWVASIDYTTDVCIGDNIIKQVRKDTSPGWGCGAKTEGTPHTPLSLIYLKANPENHLPSLSPYSGTIGI